MFCAGKKRTREVRGVVFHSLVHQYGHILRGRDVFQFNHCLENRDLRRGASGHAIAATSARVLMPRRRSRAALRFLRRGRAFSSKVTFSKLVTFSTVVVLCVSKVVFLSPARVAVRTGASLVDDFVTRAPAGLDVEQYAQRRRGEREADEGKQHPVACAASGRRR